MKLKKNMKVVAIQDLSGDERIVPKGAPGLVVQAGEKKQTICFYNGEQSIVLSGSNNFEGLVVETDQQYCEDPVKDLNVKNVKYMETLSGVSYSGNLYKGKTLLGQILNEGNGGATRFIPASVIKRKIFADLVSKMADVFEKKHGNLDLHEETLLEYIFENEHFIKSYEEYLK